MTDNINLEGAKVLIVDDDKISLRLLAYYAEKLGYKTFAFSNSKEAFIEAHKILPDIFILDYMMPDLDGSTFCRKLKEQPNFDTTPVIFITSLEKTENLVDAFNAGAVDYIIKPVNPNELSARLKTHLELSFARRRLKIFAEEMKQQVEERTKQLIHSDRLATLGTMSAGIAHEINNPATFISGNLQTLQKFWDVLLTFLPQENAEESQMAFIIKEMPLLVEGMKNGVGRIKKIVDGLKTYARKGVVYKEKFPIAKALQNALDLCHKAIKDGNVTITMHIPQREIIINGDAQQIEQVLVNILINATHALATVTEPQININVETKNDFVVIGIFNNGPQIDEQVMQKLWTPFYTTKEPGKGTGLGLSISRSIIEGHNGNIEVENVPTGVVFKIMLPLL